MLTHHRTPVCLSWVGTDLPVWSVLEAAGTLYQKEQDRFHLLLTEPPLPDHLWTGEEGEAIALETGASESAKPAPRLLWLEISPYRVIMTMQGNGKFSYRHFWEQGVYGLSRYWLQSDSPNSGHLRLRNFTRSLILQGSPIPHHLRIEYELWSDKVPFGRYVLDLDIQV